MDMINTWNQTTLADFTTLERGFDLPENERSNGTVPILGSFGVTGWHNKSRVKGPGITVGRSGASFGVVSYTIEDYWPLNTALYVKDFHGNDPRFAFYFLKTFPFKNYNSGSAQPSLNRNFVHPVPVLIPPLDEQRRIADILGALDDKIDLNRRMNRTLEDMAQTLFRAWFIDFEGVPDEDLVDSELGRIPRGWEVRSFYDVCSAIFSGGTPKTSESIYWNGGLPWLSSGETREPFILKTEKTITQDGVNGSSTRLALEGTTVIASAGQGKTRGQTSLLLLDAYINQSVVALRADPSQVSNLFLFFALRRRYDEFRRISDSFSSRGSLTTKLLGNLNVAVPPMKSVKRFDSIADPLMKKIHNDMLNNKALSNLRDTLLPKLISGEIRVPEAEKVVEAAL